MRERIGKYRIHKEVGRGASSTVYLAVDEFYNSGVAVKVYDVGLPEDESVFSRKQFLSEASLVGQLSHPHIVAILDAYVDADVSYVASPCWRSSSGRRWKTAVSSISRASCSARWQIAFLCRTRASRA